MSTQGPPPPEISLPITKATKRQSLWIVVGVMSLVAVAFFLWRRSQTPPEQEQFASFSLESLPDDLAPKIVESPGFLGPNACAPCHAERVGEFEKTNHFHTFRSASSASMPLAGFAPGKSTFATPDPQLRFEMSHSGDSFSQTAVHAAATGETSTVSSIDQIIGAGTADDVYVSWHADGKMYELPIAWLHTSQQWGSANFDPFGSGDHSRELNPRCVECHNTWVHHVPGTPNQYQREHALFGVTCERCHGPANEHVAYHREHPGSDEGRSIVRPARLNRELQLAVCTQCHSNAMKLRGPAFSHQPGQSLEASFKMLRPPHNEEDHVANQIQYLRHSRCFQEAETMTCTTCHDPHRGREGGRLAAAQESCLKCHHAVDCDEQERLPVPVRNNCTGCHMPAYVKMNVTFATADDAHLPPMFRYEHRIGIYPQARNQVVLEWMRTQSDQGTDEEVARLTAELVTYWTEKAAWYKQEHRVLAVIGAYREALRAQDSPEVRGKLRTAVAVQVRLDRDYARALHMIEDRRFIEAIPVLEGVLRVKPNLAKAHGRLGTVLAALGEKSRALSCWQAAGKYDPDDSYGEAMLGWAAYLDGDPATALAHLAKADEIEPYNAKIQFHMALALASLERPGEAIDQFRKVLEIDPFHAEACYHLATILCQEGLADQAIPVALRSVQLTKGGNVDALLALVRAYYEGGGPKEAQAVAQFALELAQARSPDRVSEVQTWLRRVSLPRSGRGL
jgi:tetratricopeptide (TPR) repeat protein